MIMVFVVKHGLSHTKIYFVWRAMRHRCMSPDNPQYKDYGGRGIKVCERWFNVENFVADLGHAPKGRTLERLDNDGDYELGNCCWASRHEQQANMRNNVYVTKRGLTLTIAAWARRMGISYNTLRQRHLSGKWP